MIPPSSATTEPVATEVSLFNAGGRAAEIDEVFRRILASGSPLDQIEIACPSDAHVSLIWEKALRHEWPVTLGTGIPAAFTRPGRALIGLCNWIETDFAAGHFRRLCSRATCEWKTPSNSPLDRQHGNWPVPERDGGEPPTASPLPVY